MQTQTINPSDFLKGFKVPTRTTSKQNKSAFSLLSLIKTKQKIERDRLKLVTARWKEIETPDLRDIVNFTGYIKEQLDFDIRYSEAEGFLRKKGLKNTKKLVR